MPACLHRNRGLADPLPALLALGLGLALLVADAAVAKTESFELDPVHTRVAFQVSHAGLSNPVGSFSGSTGSLDFDPQDWTSARLSVRIPISTLDLGDGKWQQSILGRSFLEAKEFPEARFVSTSVLPTGEHTAQVNGQLTLHGVTRPVTLAVTLNALKRHPLTFRRTAGFSATATLSRKQFGISAWKAVVGDEVHLIIEAEAVRRHGNSSDSAQSEQAADTQAEPIDADADSK